MVASRWNFPSLWILTLEIFRKRPYGANFEPNDGIGKHESHFFGILVKFHCKCTFFRIFKENPAWSVTSALQKLWMNTPHFSPRISPLTHLSSCIPVQHSWLYQCVFTSLLIKEFGIWYYNITKVLQKYLFQGIHTVIFFVKVFQMY